MATAMVHEAPSLAFLRFEQARRELSMKRTDALRRKKYEAEQQQKKVDALEQRRAQRVAAIEKAWERRQLVVRVSYMVCVCTFALSLCQCITRPFRFLKQRASLRGTHQGGVLPFFGRCKQGRSAGMIWGTCK
jgi:hypothetical protein